jgi:hypothetical protein
MGSLGLNEVSIDGPIRYMTKNEIKNTNFSQRISAGHSSISQATSDQTSHQQSATTAKNPDSLARAC